MSLTNDQLNTKRKTQSNGYHGRYSLLSTRIMTLPHSSNLPLLIVP